MTVTTQPSAAAAGLLRSATETSIAVWTRAAKALPDAAGLVLRLPTVDLSHAVERYFGLAQKTIDADRQIALRWVELLTSLTGTVRDQTEVASHLMSEQVDKITDLVSATAVKAADQVTTA